PTQHRQYESTSSMAPIAPTMNASGRSFPDQNLTTSAASITSSAASGAKNRCLNPDNMPEATSRDSSGVASSNSRVPFSRPAENSWLASAPNQILNSAWARYSAAKL